MTSRRDFLKLGGAAAVLLSVSLTRLDQIFESAVEVSIQNRMYRGTSRGKISVSTDQGKSWEQLTNLGPDYNILDIFADRQGQMYAEVGYKGYRFNLAAANQGKTWKTIA